MLVGSLAVSSACAVEAPMDSRPVVGVSIPPQKYLVDRIAGDLVRVEVMIPPGANPHSYEPTIAQMKALEGASVYVKVGHPAFAVERSWLEPVLSRATGVTVVDCSEGIRSTSGDPHIWVAPANVDRIAIRVATVLEHLLPQDREILAGNLSRLRSAIDALDRDIRSMLRDDEGRAFLVYHPAWGHFADAYGLRQIAIERDHREPGPKELRQLIASARAERIRTIFVQPQLDESGAQIVAAEIGAEVREIDPLAYDWDENLRRVATLLARDFQR
jgi:zinc transport system substrate-binding protein